MAVFPDRIVHKNSSGTDSEIRALIATGGANSITQGEIVVSTNPANPAIYIKDASGNIQTVAGGGGGGGGGSSSVIISNTPPTTKDNGDPLLQGDAWFNPTNSRLYIYGPDRSGLNYIKAASFNDTMSNAGASTDEAPTFGPGFAGANYYANALSINLISLDASFQVGVSKAVWISHDNGETWAACNATLAPPIPATYGDARGLSITPIGIDTIDLSSLLVRIALQDPNVLGWQQIAAESLVRSVNKQTGDVLLGVNDMNDVLFEAGQPPSAQYPDGQGYLSNDEAPLVDAVYENFFDAYQTSSPPDGFGGAWRSFENTWTAVVDPSSAPTRVRMVLGSEPTSGERPVNWALSSPSTSDLYGEFTVTQTWTEPDGDPITTTSNHIVRIVSVDYVGTSAFIEWMIADFDPMTVWWGYQYDNPNRPGQEVACQLQVKLAYGIQRDTDPKDGQTLQYNSQLGVYETKDQYDRVLSMLDVRSTPYSASDRPVYSYDLTSVRSDLEGNATGLATFDHPTGVKYLTFNKVDKDGRNITEDPGFPADFASARVWYAVNGSSGWMVADATYIGSPFDLVNGAGGIYYLVLNEPWAFNINNPSTSIMISVDPGPFGSKAWEDGQTLVWNSTFESFFPGQAGSSVEVLDDLADVDTSTTPPTDNQALVYDASTQIWRPLTLGPTGGGGALIAEVAYEEQATNASGEATFAGLGFWGQLVQIECDADAWVTLYTSAASRTADLARSFGAAPVPGAGVLAGFNLTADSAFQATPPMSYFNGDVIKTNAIYALARTQSGTVIDGATIKINAYGTTQFTVISGGTFGS